MIGTQPNGDVMTLTAKQIEHFRDDAERYIRDLGAKDAPPNLSQFQLDTKLGILWISVQDGWIACCFKDSERAKAANLGDRLNTYSGKWNWHEGPDGLIYFVKTVYGLLDRNDASAIQCVQKVMHKLALDLTEAQARELWHQCRDRMASTTLITSVIEIENATGGNLDTLIRGDLSDAIAQTLTGMPWPCNGDSDQVSRIFLDKVVEQAKARGYQAT